MRFGLTALLLITSIVTGCSLVPKKHIYTEINIDAKTATVWGILVDNEQYPEWNPYHVRVDGELEIGKPLQIEIHKPNNEVVRIEPHVMRMVPLKELTWGGGIQGIFFGVHVFSLEAQDGMTKFIHKEDFSGIAVSFASLDAIEEGYNLMNQALKVRAETFEPTK